MDLQTIVTETWNALADDRGSGNPARYIPALAAVDPRKFGIAIATPDGRVAAAGDVDEAFSIQSISKVFALALALGAGRSSRPDQGPPMRPTLSPGL